MGVGVGYVRRQPETGALHEAVRRGWPSVESRVPKRVREEVRRYLECGQLRYGFLEVACEGCRELSLVAFSCKGRGWCPSCTTRRAVETALRLEAQLPEVAHRQWTLSVPRGLRLAVVKRPGLLKVVEKALVRAVWRWQRGTAKGLGVTGPLQGAATAFSQWFGSSLQLTPHLHVLVPEAQWRAEGEVVELPPPDDADVEAVLERLVRQLRAALADVEGALPDDEYEGLQQEALQGQLQLPGEARARKRRVAVRAGFSLHADTAVHGHDREGLARLCRYAARGPVAESRVRRLPDGRYEYTTKHGLSLVMTAEALVKRLVALVPPSRQHLTAAHGVYAANARLRPVVLRQEPTPKVQEATPAATAEGSGPRAKRRPKLDWATVQARTFGEDVWQCGRCGGRRRIVAVVTSHRTAEEVLRNLGLLPKRKLLPPEHGPPQLELAM